MRSSIRLVVFIILVVVLAMPLSAGVYTWKDENGNTIISTSPPPGADPASVSAEKDTSKVREAERKRPTPEPKAQTVPTPAPASRQQVRGQRSYADVRVILYTTDWCPYCKKARDDLNALGVNLIEYDIERDRYKADEMRLKGGINVPFIDVEGDCIRGYNASAIKAAVEKKRNPG